MLVEGLILAAAGLGAYLLASRGGRMTGVKPGSKSSTEGSTTAARLALVLYTAAGEGTQEFVTNARTAGRAMRTAPVPVIDGRNVLDAVRTAPAGLGLVLMIGHGTSSAFFRPGRSGLRIDEDALPTWLGDDTFTRELAPKLASPFVLSLAGCRSGAEPHEADWTSDAYWTTGTTGPGGAGSLAGQIRDSLVRAGAPAGEVRAHTTTGGVLANPAGRVFLVDPRYEGRPGAALIDLVLGPGSSGERAKVLRWNSRARGAPAMRWMLGGTAPTRAEGT